MDISFTCGLCNADIDNDSVDTDYRNKNSISISIVCPDCKVEIAELSEAVDHHIEISNETIEENNTLSEQVSTLEKRVEELEEFINHYIDDETD